MKRLLLTLRYDGSEYHGWQVQPNGITIQETLQDALQRVLGKRPDVTGCSRTDSGVHANQFCCHFDVETKLTESNLVKAVNANLPRDVAAYNCIEVPVDFHARYSCKEKKYLYKISNSKVRNPFYNKYALHINRYIDDNLLNNACTSFVGEYDFKAFSSSGSTVKDTVRTISDCSVIRDDELIFFSVTGNGFLYNMVRILVGTLLYINEGKVAPEDISTIINSKDRSMAGPTAPAHGLYLDKVIY